MAGPVLLFRPTRLQIWRTSIARPRKQSPYLRFIQDTMGGFLVAGTVCCRGLPAVPGRRRNQLGPEGQLT